MGFLLMITDKASWIGTMASNMSAIIEVASAVLRAPFAFGVISDSEAMATINQTQTRARGGIEFTSMN